jgi:hypothetical protein
MFYKIGLRITRMHLCNTSNNIFIDNNEKIVKTEAT